MRPALHKVLVVYSSVVSTALLAVLLTGARQSKTSDFDEVRVHRLDIVEPDGTLRMVLSNKERLPPVIIKGVEHPEIGEARPQAGIIFYNDEGTENGGLIFSGRKNAKGEVVDSGSSLSFDRYGAGQIVQLEGIDDKTAQFAGLRVKESDDVQRVWVGRKGDGVASVILAGADGKKHIQLQVTADGKPSLIFYDEQGKVVQEVLPTH